MELKDLSAGHREVLFKTLSEQQSGDSDWDQVFALMRRGQQAAERVDLEELADQFASGQELVIDELKKGGKFFDWELQFMQLGMATGGLSFVYERIADHYRLLEAFLGELRQHLWRPLVTVLLLIVGIPSLGLGLGQFTLYEALGNLLLALVPGVVLVCAIPLSLAAYRSGWVPLTVRELLFRLPGIGTMLSRYQTFHFLSHLNLCIAAGFRLPQALKQSSRRMPATPMQPRFAAVHRSVQAGAKLSTALQQSKMLEGLRLPAIEPGATTEDAQIALTRAVYEDCVAQAAFWSRALPWLLLAMLPYAALVNAWSL
ncbi:MAG: type II secretory pathway component PulF [Bermanella sp.]|jgi:type II secretory pathway component PulF